MKATDILLWARIGSELTERLAVPVSAVIQLFRDTGGTDDEAKALVAHWHSLTLDIEARIAALKAKG